MFSVTTAFCFFPRYALEQGTDVLFIRNETEVNGKDTQHELR
jgi:hypothetical protein